MNSLMAVSNTKRLVILGKTGAGKSSLANTIFGETDLFRVDHTANSETGECQAEAKSVNGRSIKLIDTPGFFDTDRSEEELKPEIVKCITECAPGPHAFLIVFKVEKITEQEQAVINKIRQYFSDEVFKYATVVFTHGDQLKKKQTIKNFVHKNKIMSDLIKKCGGRCYVIDNKYWKNNQQDEYRNNQFQVEELLKTIDMITEANNGSCYTNEMLQAVEEVIQQEEEHIRQSSGNMSEEEIREKAQGRVERILINLAGVTTGALLGALFGVLLLVGQVVTVLKKSLSEPGRALPNAALGATLGGGIGGTAAGVTLGGAAITLGVVAGAVAAAGAVKGGFTGYDEAKEANTPQEAAKRTAKAVTNEALSAFKGLDIKAKDKTESKPLMCHDSERGK